MKAAEQNYVNAQFNLAVMYNDGSGVKKDNAQAFSWFYKAAANNDPQSQYIVGQCYEEGDGIPTDKKKAAYWYQKSLDNGYQKAEKALKKLMTE